LLIVLIELLLILVCLKLWINAHHLSIRIDAC
jgi:hypothetical protein